MAPRGSNATLIRLLVWTNVTFLVAVLLFLKHGTGRSAYYESAQDADQKGLSSFLTSMNSRSKENFQVQRGLFKVSLHEQQGFKENRNSPSQPHRSLCHRSSQQLPKYLIFVRLVQCYGKEASDDVRKMTRRFLTDSTKGVEDVADAEAKTTYGEQSIDEAAFHVDYSGPKTHPPKNN